MPLLYSGKGIFKPLNTGSIDSHVKCVREYIANIFFYTKNNTTIMIDAGYNYPRLKEKMSWLGLDPKDIKHILITHQDTDHVGAAESDSDGLFKDALLYISEAENRYLTGEKRRKVIYGLYTLPQVTIPNQKRLFKDGEVFYIDDIKIECFLTPGHTSGHTNYLIDDKYLFTGDSLWLGADGGYSFINTLAEDNDLSKRSLLSLKNKLRGRSLIVITGHTGWTDDFDFAFAHVDEYCNSFFRQRPADPKAPFNGYDERSDTLENSKKPLPRATQLEQKNSFWDRTAGVYDIFAELYNKKTHDALGKYINSLLLYSDRVLECACGTGMLTKRISGHCKQLYATDFSSAMLKKAHKKCRRQKNIKFRHADITRLKFPDNTFDAVIAANVIHLLDDPSAALNELMRVCKTNGKVIIPTYINKDDSGKTVLYINTINKAGADFKQQFTYAAYKDFFAQNGFTADFTLINGRVPCAVAVIKK